jgi:hypothetical protein
MRGRSVFLSAAAAALAFSGLSAGFGASTGSTHIAKSGNGQQADKGSSPAKVESRSAIERAIYGGYSATRSRYPAKGWSVAHDRRMARKRFNQAKNRRAHRG